MNDYSNARGVATFIVDIPKTHKDKIGDLYIDPKWQEVKMRVGHGKVVGAIEKCPNVKKGDELWFHHNVTAIQKPQKLEGNYYYVGYNDTYDACINNQAIARQRGEDIESVGWFIIIEPIGSSVPKMQSDAIEVVQFKFERQNIGRIAFANDNVRSLGLNVGDKVMYYNSSTYEVDINGTIYYRVRPQTIIGIIEDGKDE